MKIAFIIDPMDQLKIAKDSSIALMKEASRRGHQIFSILQNELAYEAGTVFALSRELKFYWEESIGTVLKMSTSHHSLNSTWC